jgi:hypothetical protein
MLFATLPKSALAKEKASRLSPLLLAHLDMALTAAFLRPDLNCRLIDVFEEEMEGSKFDFLVLATNEMIVMMAFSQITDRMGLVDFHLLPSAFEDIGEQPSF